MAAEHWQAVFVDTAVSPASKLRVKIPGFDNGVGTFEVSWAPLGNALPAAGDLALVVESDDGAWWAVSWESTAQATVSTGPEALRLVGAVGQPAFQNSWVSFDADRPAGFYRDRGRVYLTGIVKSGTAATVFTLPTGYRPVVGGTSALLFNVDANGAHGLVAVSFDGQVFQTLGTNVRLNLENISFRHT